MFRLNWLDFGFILGFFGSMRSFKTVRSKASLSFSKAYHHYHGDDLSRVPVEVMLLSVFLEITSIHKGETRGD